MMSSMSVPSEELRRSIVSLNEAWLTKARDASFKLYWTPWVVSLARRPLAVTVEVLFACLYSVIAFPRLRLRITCGVVLEELG
jgi:hypothetical protein